MKESPGQRTLYEKLLPGAISAEGFLGTDSRPPQEIMAADARRVEQLGTSSEEMADRMERLTRAAMPGLGSPVTVGGLLEVTVTDSRGRIPCPFSDNVRTNKQLTFVRNLQNGRSIGWSDLNIHMIAAHGFFEGEGSPFRVDPDQLWAVIGAYAG